jgi:cytidylate kinase
MVPANDAKIIDSSKLTFEQVLELMLNEIDQKISRAGDPHDA